MKNIKLRNQFIDGKWYKVKTFLKLEECNEFLEENKNFGLLAEKKGYKGNPVYITAQNDDKGAEKLNIYFESEDTGFCQRYYKADCGRLFVIVDGALHTCQDDAWREPCSPVKEELFIINESEAA